MMPTMQEILKKNIAPIKETLQSKAYKKYPILQKYKIEIGHGKPSSLTDQRKIEFYHPSEDRNPRPGKPFVEIISENLKNPIDTAYTDALHYLHEVDPKMKEYREWLRNNRSPQQKINSKNRYESYTNPNSKHYNSNNPETRSYEDWFEISDLDQLLGGYTSGAWPKEGYTPEQIEQLDNMVNYSKNNDMTKTLMPKRKFF
jgi:hypothetical protein|tara:strand:+ start:888 stop:1490 length:603 start_codon:yes stop_codon:yes gene_type:complete